MKYFLQDLLNHIELYLDSLNSQILTNNFAHHEPNGRIALVCPHYSVCQAEGLGTTTSYAKRCDITSTYVSDNMRKARSNYLCYKYRAVIFAIDISFCRPQKWHVGCSNFNFGTVHAFYHTTIGYRYFKGWVYINMFH